MFEKLMTGFKFKIGQTVQHAAAVEWEIDEQKKDNFDWPSRNTEQRWFIIERIAQECPGGVQRHYVCRGVSRNGSVTKELHKFNEVELSELK